MVISASCRKMYSPWSSRPDEAIGMTLMPRRAAARTSVAESGPARESWGGGDAAALGARGGGGPGGGGGVGALLGGGGGGGGGEEEKQVGGFAPPPTRG